MLSIFKPPMKPAPRQPAPPGPATLEQVMTLLDAINQRQVRTECRLVRLLAAHGLDREGAPIQQHEEYST